MFPTLGSAVGQILIRTDDVLRAQGVVLQASQRMTAALQTVNSANLTTLQQAQRTEASVVAIGVAGLISAQRVKQIEATFRILSGSQQRAVEYMAQLRQLADETQQPFLEMVEGATSLLPIVRRTNVEFGQTVEIAQRLALLDPMQGVRGAAFALREFLSGETISLARRFELGRSDLRDILDASNGNMQQALDGLDRYLNTMNVTKQALVELGEEGVFAFSRTRDEVIQTLSTAFTPFLNNSVIPLTRAFGNLVSGIREGKAEAIALAAVLATVAPMVARMGNLTLARAGVGLFALDLGANIGRSIVQAIGNIPGNNVDPRLREGSGEDFNAVIEERLKQLLVIMVSDFVDTALELAATIEIVRQAFDRLFAAAESFATRLQILGLELARTFAQLQVIIARSLQGTIFDADGTYTNSIPRNMAALEDIESQLNGESVRLPVAGPGGIKWVEKFIGGLYAQLEGSETRRLAPIGISDELRARMEQAAQQLKQGILGPLLDTLFPEAQEGAEDAQAESQSFFNTVFDMLQNVQDGFAEARAKAQEIIDDFNIEQQRLEEDRRLADSRESEDFNRNRARDVNEFYGSTLPQFDSEAGKRVQEQQDRIREIEEDYRERAAEDQAEFNKQQERQEQDHRDRLRDILEKSSFALEDAISERNSAAAQRALRDRETQIEEEESSYDKEKQRREDDFRHQQEINQRKHEEELAAARESLKTLVEENAIRRQAMIADFEERLAWEDQERQIRLQREQEDRRIRDQRAIEDLNRRISQIYAEAALNNTAFQNFVNLMIGARNTIVDWANNVNQLVAQILRPPQIVGAAVGSGGYLYGEKAAGGPARGWTLVGEEGPELVRFNTQATVFRHSATRDMMAGSGRSIYLNLDMRNWVVPAVDIDDLAEMIEDRVVDGVIAELEELDRNKSKL